jgi:hypothetical protein
MKSILKNIAPQWLRHQWGRMHYRYHKRAPLLQRLMHDQPVSFVSFDTAYPEIRKQKYTPPYRLDTPEIDNVPFAEKTAHLRGSDITVPEDYIAVLPGGLFSPRNSVIVTPDRNVIDRSSNTAWIGNIFERELFDRSPKRISGYATPLRGPFDTFYHTLIESLPRLLSIERIGAPQGTAIKLLCTSPPTPVEEFYLSHLSFDFQLTIVTPGCLYQIDHLVFTPFKTPRFAGIVPPVYVEMLRSKTCPNRPSRANQRFFISREKTGNRVVLNRKALLDALGPYGFTEVILEDLTFQEQIRLFYDAEVVIGPHGAGFSNLIFSPNARVIELFPSTYLVPHYYYMAKGLGLPYDYVLGAKSDYKIDGFQVDLDVCLEKLQRLQPTT